MSNQKLLDYIQNVIENMPADWLELTTHRLDIYNEEQAKTEFLDQFKALYEQNISDTIALARIPTAYDYIRLGHPLSCVLEFAVAKLTGLASENVISFSSQTTPILAVLRKNHLDNKKTQILYTDTLPNFFDTEVVKLVYGYSLEVKKIAHETDLESFDGSTILVTTQKGIASTTLNPQIDFYINLHEGLGSILLINGVQNVNYVADIQHVRRRETIAMTPSDCLVALKSITSGSPFELKNYTVAADKKIVLDAIQEVTVAHGNAILGSSGLSVQYAIMMGLIHDAMINHPGKEIKIIVPPNCYGGTNDQARRVAACLENVEIVDLPVDGDNDMVQSTERVLSQIAAQDAVPYIIAEIPTNPRVEVPELDQLKAALSKERKTSTGSTAIDPVFILDQTFCPNVHFLGEGEVLSTVRTISYASGSKFPSGGRCTAGYCVGNKKAADLMQMIALHMKLCDNEATAQQVEILAKQMPSMNQRIADAYTNTRAFVTFISETLPEAKINFVSEELAAEGFTPSVFSLDLPTKGNTPEEKETYKRTLNHRLIKMMITEIPEESKYCVSYGQLKGVYWTIPATSTQGTTKEGDKDYIARVSVSPKMDMEKHKQVFRDFVATVA